MKPLAILLVLSLALPAYPRSVRSREVFTLSLQQLLDSADVVAQVRIVAVDEEIAYPPLARAKVETAFKGTTAGTILLIDASSVEEVGKLFLVFLDDSHRPVKTQLQVQGSTFVPNPDAPYYTIVDGLQRQMPVRLTRAFGALDVAISFPEEFVVLPRELEQLRRPVPDAEPEILVRSDELYRILRAKE